MANKRVKTMIQTEIQRLKELGRSQRQCSKILGISRNSVRKYWDIAPAIPLSEYPPWARELDWKEIKEEVNSGICKSVLHTELSEKNDDIPTYSSFCRFYRAHIDEQDDPKITIKIHREPGHSVEVDYSGDGFEILDPATGEVEKVELFVGAMSYSSDFYAEFTYTQKQEDFIRAQENMIRYFGGAPQFQLKGNFYSVPYQHAGKSLEAKFNERMLYCYLEGELVASHVILRGSGHYSTLEEHYPSKKIVEVNIHLAYARKRARLISENTLFVVERLIRANRHPLKNLRKIQGILSLESKYSAKALDHACVVAIEHDKLIKRFIENCSKNYRPPKEKIVCQAPIRNKKLICLQGGKK